MAAPPVVLAAVLTAPAPAGGVVPAVPVVAGVAVVGVPVAGVSVDGVPVEGVVGTAPVSVAPLVSVGAPVVSGLVVSVGETVPVPVSLAPVEPVRLCVAAGSDARNEGA